MKNIVICGYFGFNNAGDELILESIIDNIREEENHKITVLSNDPYQIMELYNVKSVNRWNPVSIINSISGSDLVILSGGLFQDITGTLSLYYYLSLIFVSKLLKKKVVLSGIEFGPITQTFNIHILKFIIKYADKIFVRSKGSYDFLKSIGLVSFGKTVIGVDVTINNWRGIRHDYSKGGSVMKNICLILRKPYRRKRKQDYELFDTVRFCESLANQLNVKLVFVPFHLEEDMEFVTQIVKKLKFPATIVRWNKPKDLFNILVNADVIISQRLHGLIIGTILHIPTVSISTDPKLSFFMKELGSGHSILLTLDSDRVIGAVKDVWQWRKEFKQHIDEVLPKLQYRANLWSQTITNT